MKSNEMTIGSGENALTLRFTGPMTRRVLLIADSDGNVVALSEDDARQLRDKLTTWLDTPTP